MWFFWALVASWLYCISLEANKRYPLDGLSLVCLRGAGASIYLAPFVGFMEWPGDPMYYIVVLLTAAISVVGMMVQFNLAAKHNGRVANMSQPVTIIFAFAIWLFIDHHELHRMMTDSGYALGTLAAFSLMIVCLQFLRRNDTGWLAFMAIFPVGVLYAIDGVLSKLMLDTGTDSMGIALNWVWLGNIFMTLVALPVVLSRKKTAPVNIMAIARNQWFAVMGGSLAHSISWLAISLAFIAAPNPAYPGVVTSMSPIWFAIYYKFSGTKDSLSPVAGFGLAVASIILLIITTN